MAALDQSPAVDAAMLSGIATLVNASTNPAYAQVFGGTRPATPGDTTAEIELVALVFAIPAVALVGAELVFTQADLSGDMISATGTATWARFFNGENEWLFDCDVTAMAGTGPLKIDGTDGTTLFAGGRAIVGEMKLV